MPRKVEVHPFGPDADARILAALVDSSDDAIIVTDRAGTVLIWNRSAERIFGDSATERIGRSIADLIPLDRIDGLDRVQVTKAGERIEVSLTISPVRDASGATAGISIRGRDVSEQRRAQRAERRAEARWRAIIESAVDGIIVIDPRGLIEFFNPAAERLFGYRATDVIGRNVSILMPSPYGEEHDGYLARYLSTHQPHVIGIGREVSARRKDGTTFPVHLAVGEVVLDGETRFAGIVRDLTDRVKLEKRLREESGLVRVGELAAVLAHEIKNPLAAVSGAIQMLAEHMTLEEDREIAQEILRRLDGLSALMSDVLLFARPPRPQMQAVDLAGLLDALLAFLRSDPAWSELEIVLDLDHDSASSGVLIADPEFLRIAFQNLLLNAAQALGRQGTIRVRSQHQDGQLVIDVIDNGPGIRAEHQERLFTPFFTTKARGTGLGLATVRRIAEAHGGSAEVHSTGPTGTVVRLRLPLRAGMSTWRDS